MYEFNFITIYYNICNYIYFFIYNLYIHVYNLKGKTYTKKEDLQLRKGGGLGVKYRTRKQKKAIVKF